MGSCCTSDNRTHRGLHVFGGMFSSNRIGRNSHVQAYLVLSKRVRCQQNLIILAFRHEGLRQSLRGFLSFLAIVSCTWCSTEASHLLQDFATFCHLVAKFLGQQCCLHVVLQCFLGSRKCCVEFGSGAVAEVHFKDGALALLVTTLQGGISRARNIALGLIAWLWIEVRCAVTLLA